MTRPITIATRLHPFSHLPGIEVPLPWDLSFLEGFPTLLRFYDLSSSEKSLIKEIFLPVEGPVDNFTVELDMEKKKVNLFGEAKNGYFRYSIFSPHHIVKEKQFSPKESRWIEPERLSLGSHKKQEWEAIKKRLDFSEIFPLWHRLGRECSLASPPHISSGMFSLLRACEDAIASHRPEHILPAFRSLFLAGFQGMLVPRLTDTDFQGLVPRSTEIPSVTPFYLLTEGARLIRSLFFQQDNDIIALLPSLPPQFFAGRMTKVACPPFGKIDFEWSKKSLRRLALKAESDATLFFRFPPSVKKYRLRTHPKEKGEQVEGRKGLEIKSGSTYLLDRFEK